MGNKYQQVAIRGRISGQDIQDILKNKLAVKTVLCKEGHRIFEDFAKEDQLEHQTLKVSANENVKKTLAIIAISFSV